MKKRTRSGSKRGNGRLRWYQYRLRVVLVASLMVTLLCALGVQTIYRLHTLSLATSGGRLRAGRIRYWQTSDPQSRPGSRSRWGHRVPILADGYELDFQLVDFDATSIGRVNPDGLTPVVSVDLANAHLAEGSLRSISTLHQLMALDLDNTNVTDDDLKHLAPLTELRWLGLAHTPVSDAGLKHLKRLKKLEYVDLCGTRVTVEGLKAFHEALPHYRRKP